MTIQFLNIVPFSIIPRGRNLVSSKIYDLQLSRFLTVPRYVIKIPIKGLDADSIVFLKPEVWNLRLHCRT